MLLLSHKPVHLAVVDVADRADCVMGAAGGTVMAIVEGGHAPVDAGAVEARQRALVPAQPRDPRGARIDPEVCVKRAVLLHDDHDVFDLVDRGRDRF